MCSVRSWSQARSEWQLYPPHVLPNAFNTRHTTQFVLSVTHLAATKRREIDGEKPVSHAYNYGLSTLPQKTYTAHASCGGPRRDKPMRNIGTNSSAQSGLVVLRVVVTMYFSFSHLCLLSNRREGTEGPFHIMLKVDEHVDSACC